MKVNAKGFEIDVPNVGNSFYRRAIQYQNNIIKLLRVLGLTEDDVELELEKLAMKNLPASVGWYFSGDYLHFSFSKCPKYVENLYVVMKVIELELELLLNEKKSVEDFIKDFSEDQDVEKQRKYARKVLGVDEDINDMDEIHKNYKKLAKEHHPDMGGCPEKFKEINLAHKTLKRELR